MLVVIAFSTQRELISIFSISNIFILNIIEWKNSKYVAKRNSVFGHFPRIRTFWTFLTHCIQSLCIQNSVKHVIWRFPQEELTRSSQPEVFLINIFWKYVTDLQENTHTEVQTEESCKATLLKSHFGISVLL